MCPEARPILASFDRLQENITAFCWPSNRDWCDCKLRNVWVQLHIIFATMANTAAPSLRIRDWDTATKFASIIALLAGGMWTVWMYHQTAKQRADAARITAQKPFSAERLAVYEKLVTLTAAVAETDLPQQIRTSRNGNWIRS